MILTPGNKVAFTDKYGQRLIGIFERREAVPSAQGAVERCIVKAFPFSDDLEVSCIVPEENLMLVA